MKILLVDDDAFLRDMYATKFTEAGYSVSAAGDSETAIENLQSESFDVVLLDMVMPGMTGIELLEQIQAEKLGGSPKCIVLSNQGEESDKTAAAGAGATGYIVKAEMVPSEVVAEVESLIGTS